MKLKNCSTNFVNILTSHKLVQLSIPRGYGIDFYSEIILVNVHCSILFEKI